MDFKSLLSKLRSLICLSVPLLLHSYMCIIWHNVLFLLVSTNSHVLYCYIHFLWSIIIGVQVYLNIINCVQIGSPSGNSYFLLSRPRPSDSPPKEAAPSIGPQAPVQGNSSSAGQPTERIDFFRDAINSSGIGYGSNDDNLADISPQHVKKVDILSLGLPRLTTGKKLYMFHF